MTGQQCSFIHILLEFYTSLSNIKCGMCSQEAEDDAVEKQSRLQVFQGATSISSADYFGRNEGEASVNSDNPADQLVAVRARLYLSQLTRNMLHSLPILRVKNLHSIFPCAKCSKRRRTCKPCGSMRMRRGGHYRRLPITWCRN